VQNYAPVAKVGTAFDTFCVEVDTDFNPGSTYDFSVNLSHDSSGRVLTEGAAFLYYQFATGNLGIIITRLQTLMIPDSDTRTPGNCRRRFGGFKTTAI